MQYVHAMIPVCTGRLQGADYQVSAAVAGCVQGFALHQLRDYAGAVSALQQHWNELLAS